MSVPVGQASIDVLSVEFGDRAVTITYYDPRLETEFGSKIPQIVLRPEKFPEELAELMDDLQALIAAYDEKSSDIPATRPGRIR